MTGLPLTLVLVSNYHTHDFLKRGCPFLETHIPFSQSHYDAAEGKFMVIT